MSDFDWDEAPEDCVGAVKYKSTSKYRFEPLENRPFVTKCKNSSPCDYVYCDDNDCSPTSEHFDFFPRPTPTSVFTKEFKVKGGTCETWQACKIVFVGKKYTVVENENGKEFSRKTAKITIRDIDTRTDKEKACDAIWKELDDTGTPYDLRVAMELAYDKWVGE